MRWTALPAFNVAIQFGQGLQGCCSFQTWLEHVFLGIETVVRCSVSWFLNLLKWLPNLIEWIFKGLDRTLLAALTGLRRMLRESRPFGRHWTRRMTIDFGKSLSFLLSLTNLLREHLLRVSHAVITFLRHLSRLFAANSAAGSWTSFLAAWLIFDGCSGAFLLGEAPFLHWFSTLRHFVSLWVLTNSNYSNI